MFSIRNFNLFGKIRHLHLIIRIVIILIYYVVFFTVENTINYFANHILQIGFCISKWKTIVEYDYMVYGTRKPTMTQQGKEKNVTKTPPPPTAS